MLRFILLAILFVAVCAGPIDEDSKSANLKVGVVESIDEYLAENPGVEILDEFEKEEDQDRRVMVYRIGQRINGDRLVGEYRYNNRWLTPRDVTMRLIYPRSGLGALISHVFITVEQSSNGGRAVVVGGGPGTRVISVLVEARQTAFVRFYAQVFGR